MRTIQIAEIKEGVFGACPTTGSLMLTKKEAAQVRKTWVTVFKPKIKAALGREPFLWVSVVGNGQRLQVLTPNK